MKFLTVFSQLVTRDNAVITGLELGFPKLKLGLII